MNDKVLLNEFENTLVATIYTDRVELDGTVEGMLEGSGFYPKVEDGCYYIVDVYNDYEITYLADDLTGALMNLNKYIEYFNYYPNGSNFIEWHDDKEEFWISDFEYTLRSAYEFKIIVNGMQNYLKEGNE